MKTALVLMVLAAVGIAGCAWPGGNHLPPAQMLMEPGPGVGGPGPGVMSYQLSSGVPGPTSQIAFVGPEGMRIAWDVGAPGLFDSEPLLCPGHYNFPQGAIYRLKLTHIPGRSAVELYPTLEIGPAVPRTEAFLAHNAVPIQFTPEDFDQVLSGNMVTKVVYLPDPDFQDMALAGVETLVSTRLDPGVDPIVEADRQGAILAVVRMGNKDLETPSDYAEGAAVMQTAYYEDAGSDGYVVSGAAPMGLAMSTQSTLPTNYVSGVNGPQYGMPISGTPIGLPGPPHVPLGTPASLQKHTISNHTRVSIPQPTSRVRIDVNQAPGYSYPPPGNQGYVIEQAYPEPWVDAQPIPNQDRTYVPGGALVF